MQGFTPSLICRVTQKREWKQLASMVEQCRGSKNLEEVEMTPQGLQAQVGFLSHSSLSSATQANEKLHH